MDEQELVRQIQQGDEMAFAEIVRIYKNRIVNFLWKITGDYQKAVELSQETFMRVYFKAHRYRPIASFSSWIYTIASNLAKTEMKKLRKFTVVSLDDVQNVIPVEASADNPGDSGLIKSLRNALNSLHPRYRIPVILKDIEGFSQEEIAEMLKRPIGTIKARISRGREYLRKELEKASSEGNTFALKEEH
ncbi:MAG: sigma-70 family RNA polymerase sigma factor [Candidatus Aminicenantes bacterium]|nr:sigma-70 family RNA polymerase sigma factor [Candidatus Aminicenantes bacterium]MDH5706140.1 sigma-70 family RNA polymerase sigma factor [Candidatus Aminicenantes bacterium]